MLLFEDLKCCEFKFWLSVMVCAVLLALAGITSGLALGLLSFSQVDLEVLIKSGKPKDRKNAAKILPVVKNGHFVLCTLLIGKSLAMEALPVFLDRIVPAGYGYYAILISAPLVTTFAEIVPQAVCARYGLTLGGEMVYFVRLLLLIFFPISYPASKLLDWIVGKEHSVLLRRSELRTLVDLHRDQVGKGGELSHVETSIITGAMDLTEKTVRDAMTPISQTFSLDINSKLDMHTMTIIVSKGHSRIPVYAGSPSNVVGIILVKSLIFCHPEEETPVKNLTIRKFLVIIKPFSSLLNSLSSWEQPTLDTQHNSVRIFDRVYEHWPLYDILKRFQKCHSHMAVVLKSSDKAIAKNNPTHSESNPTFLNIITNSNSIPTESNIKASSSPTYLEEQQRYSLYSADVEIYSPTLDNVTGLDNELDQQWHQWEPQRGLSRYMSQEEIETLPPVSDEEVVGIITMEDVMEELLQGEILDETDEYVHVQKIIRVNLQPQRTQP